MQISTSNIMLLINFQELDARLGNDREKETEQLFMLLDVLKEEATPRSLDVYTSLLQQHHPGMHPWSAIRPMELTDLPASAVMEKQFKRAPPALFLILSRRPELEPDKAGDDVFLGDSNGKAIWEALKNWSPSELKSRIGPDGWKEKQFGLKIPPAKPKPGQLFTPPYQPVPRPPIPDPPLDPPPVDSDPAPPEDPAPPLDPVEPEPPTDEPPETDDPETDDPPETEPPEAEPPDDDIEQPVPPDSKPWKEVGVTAAWAVGIGAVAFWLGNRSST